MKDAFRHWAETYDCEPNALLQLGDRALSERLGDLSNLRALDAGCGTSRWVRRANEAGARATGFDREPAMLARAQGAAVALAELGRAPFRARTFDLVVAAFSLSYADEPAPALEDLCGLVRSQGRVAIVDLHPDAVEAGWRRTFVSEGRTVEITGRVEAVESALVAPPAGWRIEVLDSLRFDEPERGLFEPEHWRRVREAWAIRLAIWRREV